MPRLFSGIELPPEIREDLESLRQPLPSTKWIQTENLHITLRYVGDVAPPVAREFTANLANITFDPFPIRIVGLNTFGGENPRVLFATIEPAEPLANLARSNETAARRAGIKPESRKYIPHVTLARMQAPPIQPIARFLSRHGGFATQAFLVSQFVLFSAKPITGGGPYVAEQSFASTLGNFDEVDWDENNTSGFGANDR